MKQVSRVLAVTMLIATISSTSLAGSITTMRSSRTGSITTLSRGSITTLRSGSITTLRSGSITTLSSEQARTREEETPLQELFGAFFSMFYRAIW